MPYKTIYTQFGSALEKITTPEAGPIEDFVGGLQAKLDEKLELLQNKEERQTSPAPSRELGDCYRRYPFLNARIDNSQD